MEHDLDAWLELVASQRRRRIIRQLRNGTDGETTVDDLVDRLHEPGSGNGHRPARRELEIELHHHHLPKLDDHGVVDYDRDTGSVRYRPDDGLEAVVDSLSNEPTKANL